jgi:predicted nucleic acid-binding Zn ribbon protein
MSTKLASDILKELFSSMKIDPSQETIFEAWPDLVGSEAASHLKIQDIKGKTLLLLADHPGWVQMAQLKKKEILEKIKKRFPDNNISIIKISLR